ncbi:MAG TPA: uroporphyrinogen decarboxylase [Candidatus Hydrogenedentes bacterium]|nr:uroporphyrinogen decarboxylase [Candidatus Hydrogenedentota bacterium]
MGIENTLFMRAARGETTERPPIWLMRQAGRSDPAYRALREECPLPLEAVFRRPDMAAEISMLPARWGVDAIIIFQDILTPLSGMGTPFVFRPGPQLESPVNSVLDLELLHLFDMADELPFVARIYALLRNAVQEDLPLIGFAGAPFTLFSFLAENGSPPADLPNTRALMTAHPGKTRQTLELLAAMTAQYLKYQIMCGANVVQLFESLANRLSPDEYGEWALPYQQYIFDELRATGTPAIFFARRDDALLSPAVLHKAGASILSLPAFCSIKTARAEIGEQTPVQGNLDNHLLAEGTQEEIREAAHCCIEAGRRRGHIFNLSHGLLPHTPFENIQMLVEYVRSQDGQGGAVD